MNIDLDKKMTPEEFIEFMKPEVQVEAHYTGENNETLSLGDYLSDLQRRLTYMLGLDS